MLSAFIWIPAIGAILLSIAPDIGQNHLWRRLCLGITVLLCLWSLVIASQFDPTQIGFQLQEYLPWVDDLGLVYHLGVDGVSLPLLVLNSFLTLIAVWSTPLDVARPRLYYSLILLLNTSVSGAFLAQNLLLFFLFYELELIPLYFLIGIWGGSRRAYAATKFLIYTAVSGMLILAGFLGVVWLSGATDFAYTNALTSDLSMGTQLVLLGTILVGFGIKIPFVPFHTWLPDAHVEASTPISVILAGVLLKLGTYGLLRFGLGLFPEAWQVLAPALAIWAVVSVLYGALTAIAQKDMKKMVAYSSIAHMGYILLALAAATPLALLGSIFQMVSHGLISGLLFLLVGVIYAKTGTRDLDALRGLLNPERGLPLVGSLMVIGVMASSGIPGMAGFIAEFLVFRGSFGIFPAATLWCMVGTGLTSVYFLILTNRVFFGRLSDIVTHLPSVLWRDRIPALALTAVVVAIGLQPHWLSSWSENSTQFLAEFIGAEVTHPAITLPVPNAAPTTLAPVDIADARMLDPL